MKRAVVIQELLEGELAGSGEPSTCQPYLFTFSVIQFWFLIKDQHPPFPFLLPSGVKSKQTMIVSEREHFSYPALHLLN